MLMNITKPIWVTFRLGDWLGRACSGETLALLVKGDGLRAEAAERGAINQKAERFLTEYGDGLLRFAYSYLHNLSDAEEVLQDTLLQYLKTAPVLENPAHEKAWLFRVAGNLSKNRIAYNKVRSTDELDERLAAEEREDLSFVWEAVKALPVHDREVVHLFHYEGLSTGEIAAILGQKESTVRSRLRRGRKKLRAILKEAYDFEGGL